MWSPKIVMKKKNNGEPTAHEWETPSRAVGPNPGSARAAGEGNRRTRPMVTQHASRRNSDQKLNKRKGTGLPDSPKEETRRVKIQ
jgi:hypothetical protein